MSENITFDELDDILFKPNVKIASSIKLLESANIVEENWKNEDEKMKKRLEKNSIN
jgi:hypothetical protein